MAIWRLSQLLGLYDIAPSKVIGLLKDQYPPEALKELTKGYATTGQQLKLGGIK